MKKIAIVGAGQAGLQLGIGLRKAGFQVDIYTNKTAEDLLNGNILSNQGMFDSALSIERKLGLNFWDILCPQNTTVSFNLSNGEQSPKVITSWRGFTSKPYQSIDQRLKFSRWMNEFEKLGGILVIQEVDIKVLEVITSNHDLTIVAGGKENISQLFTKDPSRCAFTTPQRALACLYLTNTAQDKASSSGVRFSLIPGIGEFFIMPGLTINGPCSMLLFEGITGGPFDCWQKISTSEHRFEQALELLKDYVPWEFENCQNAMLTDNNATLVGCYTPIVREPFFKPLAKPILGMGDSVVLNDPIAGQGANNACKAADIYLQRIIENGVKPFDENWMTETFELYWEKCAKWATKWSNMLLTPPPHHIIELLRAASLYPAIADILAEGFNDPSTLFPWISNSDDTLKLIKNFKKITPNNLSNADIRSEHEEMRL